MANEKSVTPPSDHHYGEDGQLARTERQRQLLADLERTANGGPEEVEARKARNGRVPSFIDHEANLHAKMIEGEAEILAKIDSLTDSNVSPDPAFEL